MTTVYAHSATKLGALSTDSALGSANRINQRPLDVEARLLQAMTGLLTSSSATL